jgi:unsaturated chondroitin disaccharide hydrolase
MKMAPKLDELALRSRIEETFRFGIAQLSKMLSKWTVDRPAPIHTVHGVWWRPDFVWTDWCSGFYAGMMWLAFEHTGDPTWRAAAEAHTRKLEGRKLDRDVHDLGFIFMPTVNRWHDLLPAADAEKPWLAEQLVTAASTLAQRWQGAGEDHYIYSFNGPQSLFVDVMMNIGLLFRAHRLGGGAELHQKAVAHARTTEKYLVRKAGRRLVDGEGKVIHEAIFDPVRGTFRNLSSQQGYSPFTCWARGLSWAMYGFTDTYLFTGDASFLATAERCAAYYLEHTPGDGVPFWDYGAPNIPDEPLDSSAAAVAAGAFWKLKDIAGTPQKSDTYRRAAWTILSTLTGTKFTGDPSHDGILRHGVYHKPMGWGVDESVMWGDYFYMEALLAVLREAEPTNRKPSGRA